MGVVKNVCNRFEKETDAHENKDCHTIPSFKKDLLSVVTQLVTDSELKDDEPQSLIT